MPRFFMAGSNIMGGMAIIRGRDAEHVRVLRLRPGEEMIICDGEGTDYKCRLVYADKEQAEAEVIEVVRCPAEPSVKVTVLCGLPKGDRSDYIIQKCVEAGAYEIAFFSCDRCVARPDKPEKPRGRQPAGGNGGGTRVSVSARAVQTECDVRGMSLEEALSAVSLYLDEAVLAGLNEVFIIHGKGTGILRSGIQQDLRKNKHVKSFRRGVYGEGEDGVTVVTLR